MTLPDDDRDPVDVLAEEFADRLRRGEYPSVSDYAANHPDHAEQLRDLLPAVAQIEQLKRFRRTTAPMDESLPDRFGDFRIVRELGRGGMGVVFEAVQESLGRRVALKVLARHAQLDPDKRARFVREAHAAARLHHSNIVPVFGVGEQDGLPYYVMQLIPGHGLHSIIAGWHNPQAGTSAASTVELRKGTPTPTGSDIVRLPALVGGPKFGDWEFVADAGIQAAEALHYAHAQGVLHRDVKPGNLLLEDGERVWVADFGLAKIVDLNGLTATGDILGTLQYLAPECLTGESSARSDVYGLGATLYEMLTGDPPFAADSPARLIKQIGDTSPPPPRHWNPDIPRDLETIVLKAMAREPGQRYRTAKLFADDLRAFLEDRPIRARRMSVAGRAWRWCRRNPAVALLSLTTTVALILAAAVGWGGYVQTRAALAAEAELRKKTEDTSAKLKANLDLSLEAFEKVFEAAGGNEMRPPFGPRPGGPGGMGGGPKIDDAADKTAVLEAVLAFYDKFAERNQTNLQLRFEAGKAHRRIGEMNQWLGRSDRAGASFRRAVELLDPLQQAFPAEGKYRVELMMTHAHSPLDEVSPKGYAAAEKQMVRVAELGRGLPQRWPTGMVLLKLAWVREEAGNKAAAITTYQESIAAFTAKGERERPGQVGHELSVARQRLAAVFIDLGKLPDARRVLEDAIDDQRGPPGPGRSPFQMAATYQSLADLCRQMGDGRAADDAARRANEMLMGGPKGPKEPKDPKGPKR